MTSPLRGWQILLLIEGAFTIAFAILTGFMLPWSTETASFLSDREKHVARLRILKDGSTATDTKFEPRSFFKPLGDWRYYVFASIALCYGVAASVGRGGGGGGWSGRPWLAHRSVRLTHHSSRWPRTSSRRSSRASATAPSRRTCSPSRPTPAAPSPCSPPPTRRTASASAASTSRRRSCW